MYEKRYCPSFRVVNLFMWHNCVMHLPDYIKCKSVVRVRVFTCEMFAKVSWILCFVFTRLLHNTLRLNVPGGAAGSAASPWNMTLVVKTWSFMFSLLQMVNCWYTQLYVTSDVAVLCSFIRGFKRNVSGQEWVLTLNADWSQNKTNPEMLLYVKEGPIKCVLFCCCCWVGLGRVTMATVPCPTGSEVLSIFTRL